MKRMLERYTEKNYDFIVVGGGMAGVCAAMEAARGGMKVALYANSEIAEEKIVLISGDHNGDSKLTVTDILGTIGVINGQGVSGAVAAAIDYDGNGIPTVTDLVLARKAILSTPTERVDYSDKDIESAKMKVKVEGREFR